MDPSILLIQNANLGQVATGIGFAASAFASFLGTLIVGALVLLFASDYLERMIDVVRENAVVSFF